MFPDLLCQDAQCLIFPLNVASGNQINPAAVHPAFQPKRHMLAYLPIF